MLQIVGAPNIFSEDLPLPVSTCKIDENHCLNKYKIIVIIPDTQINVDLVV